MDRKNMLVQRARDFFGDRLDDLFHMVNLDRQELRGWQEPAHLRSTLRRTFRQQAGTTTPSTYRGDTTLAQQETPIFSDTARAAGEPDPGQQREAIGRLLEVGATAVQRILRNSYELTNDETIGLEAVLLLYGRPALLVEEDHLAAVPASWTVLEDQREDIEMIQRGVGRIELFGHPDLDWAGTGFLVSENFLATTRRVAELFAERNNNDWQFRPGISAWMDYRSPYQTVSTAGYRVRSVFGVHDTYDLALLEVERPQLNGSSPAPLPLLGNPAPVFENRLDNRDVYLVGYPIRDARRNEPEIVARMFRDVYNVKRVQPGRILGEFYFSSIPFLRHDAAPLGVTAGAPIIDLETHLVIGMQLSGRYLEPATAVPLYALRDDPLFRRANIPFTEGTRRQEADHIVSQIERLARSRFWNETRTLIEQLYQRAFGV
jgi:hypothetical protein